MHLTKLRIKKALFLLLNFKYLKIYLIHKVCLSTEHINVLKNLKFSHVIDVGANNGQFSLAISYLYPSKKILAFEPIKSCYLKYKNIFSNFSNVTIRNYALGKKNELRQIYITDHNDASSFFEPKLLSKIFFENTKQNELCRIKTGKNVIQKKYLINSLLKIDVQGFELDVLKGFADNLKHVKFIYVELSHVELYKNQPLFNEVLDYLNLKGFILSNVYNKYSSSDELIQADYLFTK